MEKCCCGCEKHAQSLDRAVKNMPEEKNIASLTAFFKMMGDATRIKMMYLMGEGELCVQDIADTLGMTKSAISHQLSGLKQAGVVKSRREGKNIFYSLDDEHVKEVVMVAMTHIQHKNQHKK